MSITRTESRNRVGIIWFDTEAEADHYATDLPRVYGNDAIDAANIGFAQCGRDPGFDKRDAEGNPTEFAVVTP